MTLSNEINTNNCESLILKGQIKKELIDHNDAIKSQIDYRAQKLLKIINDENTVSENEIPNQIIRNIILKINLKLVILIDEVCNENLKQIDDYFTQNKICINDKEELKRTALSRYLIYFSGQELKDRYKDNLMNPNLGLVVEFKCYPTKNQLNFIRNKLCQDKQKEKLIYDQDLILDENFLSTFFTNKNDDVIENHFIMNNQDKSWLKEKTEFRNDFEFEIESIGVGAFKLFSKLKSLKLDDCACIYTLPTGCFDGLYNLKLLSLGACNIYKIEPNCFASLTNLESLYLSFNLFENIESYQFNGLVNLKSLHLNNLELKSIKANAFAGLTNLDFLNFSFSDIEFLSKDAFNGLHNISLLDLVFTTFHEIENENSFNHMKNLKKLFVDSNSFLNVLPCKNDSYTICNQLEEIELKFTSYNQTNDLSKINSCLFSIKSLKKLNLSAQNAEIVFDHLFDYNFFDRFVDLKHLDLSRCQIKVINDNCLDQMVNLETLDLSFNRLNGENFDRIFKNLQNLKKLDLSFNSLKAIKANYFIGLINLREMILKSCDLESIDCKSFEANLPNLELLNLDLNRSIRAKRRLILTRFDQQKRFKVLF